MKPKKKKKSPSAEHVILQVNHFNCTNCYNVWKKLQILERNGFTEIMTYIK